MFSMFTGSISTPTKESISNKAKGALGMFHSAIETLEQSQIEAGNLATNNQEIIDALTHENAELAIMAADNSNIITNIRKLIGGK